jgi:hypothetical protein
MRACSRSLAASVEARYSSGKYGFKFDEPVCAVVENGMG